MSPSQAPPLPDPDDLKARELARMRLLATGLLVLMAVVFLLASFAQRRWPALAYVRAFAEAGMVGACADWFAVTALFRRPFGLPIPHTAIIPRNKDRIGASLGRFIAENFLTEAVLRERLQALEVARWGGVWLQRPGPSRRLAERIAAVLPHLVAAAPPGAVGALVGSLVKTAVQATPVAPTAGRLLEGFRREGRTEALIEWALRNLHDVLAEHRTAICEEAVSGSGWASRWLDRLVAGRVIDAALHTLSEMRDPEHRIRRRIRAAVIRWSRRLRSDAALQAKAEALKQDLLVHPVVLARLADFEDLAEAGILRGILAEQGSLAPRLEQAIRGFGRWLADNAAAQGRLNAWARDLATGAIAPRRQQIGGYVAGVVSSWDAGLVTAKLELQVGRDLQYIRINGTLVGGLVGLAIFAIARALKL